MSARLLRSSTVLALGMLLPTAASSLARAQDQTGTAPAPSTKATPAPQNRNEQIQVFGIRGGGLVPKSSSAATKSDTSLITTPESVSVITRAQLDQLDATTLTQALRYNAGVNGDVDAGYTTRYDEVEIRGFEGTAGADEFLDDLRLFNGAYYGTQQIDPALLDRIDVLKGPPSVLYGQSSPGGAIVLTTKQPVATPIHELSFEGGTYDYVRGTADFGGKLDQSGDWLYRLAGTVMSSGTQDLHTRNRRYALLPSITWLPNDRTTLTVTGIWQDDPRGGDFDTAPIEGTILPGKYGPVSSNFYEGDAAFDKYSRTQASIGYHFAYDLNRDWSFHSIARYTNVGAFFSQVAGGGELDDDGETLERAAYGSEEHYDTVSLEEQLHGHFNTGPIQHSVIVGVNWQNLRDSANLYYGDASPIDIYQSGEGIQSISSDYSLYEAQQITTNQEAIFGEDQMTWGHIHAQIGVRHDWSDIDTRDYTDTDGFNQNNQATTWRGGILYAFDDGLSPYFNYAQSFQPTNSLSFDGTPFQPTRGEQYEVGLKFQPHNFNGFFTAALYNLQQTNVLVADPEHEDFYVQEGGIRSRGVELEAHLDITHRFNLIASYAYQDVAYNKNSGSLDGERPTSVPAQEFSIWGHYNIDSGRFRGLGGGVGVRYSGDTIADNTIEYVTPAYTLVDAQLQYALGNLAPRLKGMLAQLTVQNLLNQRYYPGCYSAADGCYLGQTRNIVGKITYNW